MTRCTFMIERLSKQSKSLSIYSVGQELGGFIARKVMIFTKPQRFRKAGIKLA